MVLQRSLASVGVSYDYHIKSVSCETFALMMIGLFEELQAIQQEVLRSHRSDLSEEEQSKANIRNEERYNVFYNSVKSNIEKVRPGVILTLDFLIKVCLKPLGNTRHRLGRVDPYRGSMPTGSQHIDKATKSYNALMDAVYHGDKETVISLVNDGLDPKSITAYGKTALTVASTVGDSAICNALMHVVLPKYRADVYHKDGNGRAAIEYAAYLMHSETLCVLKDTTEPRDKVQIVPGRGVINW